MRRIRATAGLLFALLVSPVLNHDANATPVTYNGGVFDWFITGVSGSELTGWLVDITYTADFTNFTGDDNSPDADADSNRQDYVGAVNFKLDGGTANLFWGTLNSTNAGTVSNWSILTNNNASANGCNGNGNGFLCAEVSPFNAVSTQGPYSYFWSFTLQYGLGTLGDETGPIRAWFVQDATGRNAGLMSLSTAAQVPEPNALLLLGAGVLLVAARLRHGGNL